jgi:hypothetical protein
MLATERRDPCARAVRLVDWPVEIHRERVRCDVDPDRAAGKDAANGPHEPDRRRRKHRAGHSADASRCLTIRPLRLNRGPVVYQATGQPPTPRA